MPEPAATSMRNPMPLLHAEEQHGDHQAREALFLTFNADLNFFESQLLGVCRSAGAVVTVIADAHVWNPDPLAIRAAGRAYHVGLASMRGAFHPKLLVLAGEERFIVSLGSGNLTLGGWQHNAELWTTVTGTAAQAPAFLADLAEWLRRLSSTVVMDSLSAKSTLRVAAILEQLLTTALLVDTGHRLMHSADTPILEQLPRGPVDSLRLSAPFHDPECVAVQRLIEHLEPAETHIAVQPGWTKVEPKALRAVLRRHANVSIARDNSNATTDGRYRHGKLIEWTQGGQTWALAGSANLSQAALMLTHATGGNCEIGLTSTLQDSLFPEAEPLELDELAVTPEIVEPGTEDDPEPRPELMAARTHDGRLTVELAGPSPVHCVIEVSHRVSPRQVWDPAGHIDQGQSQVTIDLTVAGGDHLRLRWQDSNGTWTESPFRPITDPETALRPPVISDGKRVRRATPLDIFGDLANMQDLGRDLQIFSLDVAAARAAKRVAPRHAPGASHEGAPRLGTDLDTWDDIVRDSLRRHGHHLAAFALALPEVNLDDAGTHGWLDQLTNDTEASLDEDTTEAVAAEAATDQTEVDDNTIPDQREDPEPLRAARRRWAKQAVEAAPHLTLVSRMLILRFLIGFYSAGNWNSDDMTPLAHIRDLIATLDQPEANNQLRDRTASLAAVALTVIRQRALSGDLNDAQPIYDAALRAAHAEDLSIDRDAVAEYCRYAKNAYGFPLDADDVVTTISALATDPLADLTSSITRRGWTIKRHADTSLTVDADIPGAEMAAVELVGEAEQHRRLAVLVRGRHGRWCLVARDANDLIVVKPGRSSELWHHYRLEAPFGVGAFAHQYRTDPEAARRKLRNRPPLSVAPAAATEVLRNTKAPPLP